MVDIKGTILEVYRGYTITDEPNGGYAISIYDEKNNLQLDTDSDTLEEARRSVDYIADEREAEQELKDQEEYEWEHRRETWDDLWPRRAGHWLTQKPQIKWKRQPNRLKKNAVMTWKRLRIFMEGGTN